MSNFLVGLAIVAPIFIGGLLLFNFPVQWLWNSTMPEVFGLREVTYWQMLRLDLLALCIFGGSFLSGGSKK